jgi:hypothetical protein
MQPPLVTVRASALSGYPDCPRRAAARMFRREIEAAGYSLKSEIGSIGSAVGSAVHSGVSHMLSEKARSGTLAPVREVTDLAVDALHARIYEGVLYDRETPNGGFAETQAIGMLRSYAEFVAPTVNPILVETRLEADTGFGILLSGQSDQVAREPDAIRDLKTGKRRSNHRAQIGAYSLLARSHGYQISRAFIDFLQRVPVSKTQPEPESIPQGITGCETAAANILRHIADDLMTWRHGDPERRIERYDPWSFPANPASRLCSARWCQAFGTRFCREGGECDE